MATSGGSLDEKTKVEQDVVKDTSAIPVDEQPVQTQIIPSESTDEEFESGQGLLTGAKYDIPDSADTFVDTKDGAVVDKKDLTPFQMIKAIAEQNGNKIQDPSKGCKHCLGRGYDGLDAKTQMPIPCSCLFRGKTAKQKEEEGVYDANKNPKKISRAQRRKISRSLFNRFKSARKNIKSTLADEKVTPDNLPEKQTDEAKDNELINKVLRKYIKLQSLKQTAYEMSLTLTETKKIIKGNRAKLEKMNEKVKE